LFDEDHPARRGSMDWNRSTESEGRSRVRRPYSQIEIHAFKGCTQLPEYWFAVEGQSGYSGSYNGEGK
jgi:hypothetical protein